MAINRISGNILQDNLERGSNLAVQGNLVYFDVVNDRVGILTSNPESRLDVNGNLRVGNTMIVLAGNIVAGNAWINNVQDPVANTDAATKQYVDQNVSNVLINITDGSNTQTVYNGATVVLQGNTDQTAVTVSDPNTITVTLTSNVTVGGNIASGNVNVVNGVIANNITAVANITADAAAITSVLTAANVVASNSISANTAVFESATANTVDILSTLTVNVVQGNNELRLLSVANANISIEPGTGLVKIDSVSGLVLPTGNTTQRPATAETGTIRFNTDTDRAEIFDGAEWDQIVSDVSGQLIIPDGVDDTYALDRDSTSFATLVAINGVVQLPTVAYTVVANSIVFAEVPSTSDIIDIRFL